MSDVWESGDAEEGSPSGHSGDHEEEEQGVSGGKTTIHVHSDGARKLLITELTARTLMGVLDSIAVRGAPAKFQLAMAQQELFEALEQLEKMEVPLNRAARRRTVKPPLVHG